MGQIIIPYEDAAGTKYGYSADADQQSVLDDYCAQAGISRTAPYGNQYASMAALNAVSGWSGAIAPPSGLQERNVRLGFGDNFDGNTAGNQLANVAIVVGDIATFASLYPTGATPLPETARAATNMIVTVLGAQGESRLSN
jgi:hypothetical protein